MLLDLIGVLKKEARCRKRLSLLILAVLLAGNISCADTRRPPCVLEVPVYGPTGSRLDFRIIAVTREDDKKADFLKAPAEARMTVDGNRLYFPRGAANGLRIAITLENKGGKRTIESVPLLACEQWVTVRYAEVDSGADVFISSAEGRLSGCPLDGDWWIRTVPMFGTPDVSKVLQGYIRRSDGFFRIHSISGERLLVVVGKDKNPVRVFAVDVTAGGKNEIGIVDLAGSCPK